VGSILVIGALLTAFNVVLDGRLHHDADNLLRDRASAQLRTLSVVDGRLRVPEAPDKAIPDTRTWIFAGAAVLEQPVSSARDRQAALSLAHRAPAFETVAGTGVRLYAVPVVQASHRLGVMVVGASLLPYDSSARTALIASLILGALTILAIAATSWWMIRRALAPVADMTAKAADWGEHHLSLSRRFYSGEPHDELTTLAATFDQLLERLAHSLRREQRFTAEISHELRTPLARIVAEAELAASRERSPVEYRNALDSIRAAAEQLGGALDALLAAARSEQAGISSALDGRGVAERAAASHRDSAERRGVKIEVTGSAPNLRVGTEPDLVDRTLAPIVDNAVRHAKRLVSIGVTRSNDHVVFEVRDDGPGIEPRLQERIFEPGVSTTNGEGSGAGLGLPLAQRLARAGGGEIECARSATGANFSVRFPLV
jgi:signal transduction histidine kinase